MAKEVVKQNVSDVRKGFLSFLGYFSVLSLLLLVSVYFFFKSYSSQQDKIEKDVIAYKELLNKQQELHSNLDEVYNHMSMINSGSVKDDALLDLISDNIKEIRSKIKEDEEDEFMHYSFLLSKIDSILDIKSDVIVNTNRKNSSQRDLNDCIENRQKTDKKIARYGRN